MKPIIKNIILLAVVLLASYFTAVYFGAIYDRFVPQYDDSLLSLPREGIFLLVGFPFAYVFFTVFIFSLFGFKEESKWIIGFLSPAALLWLLADLPHIYLPFILGIIAYILALIIRTIYLTVFHKVS
jgi:hypothetical protein